MLASLSYIGKRSPRSGGEGVWRERYFNRLACSRPAAIGRKVDFYVLEVKKNAVVRVKRLVNGLFYDKQERAFDYGGRIASPFCWSSYKPNEFRRKRNSGLDIDPEGGEFIGIRDSGNRNLFVMGERADHTRGSDRSARDGPRQSNGAQPESAQKSARHDASGTALPVDLQCAWTQRGSFHRKQRMLVACPDQTVTDQNHSGRNRTQRYAQRGVHSLIAHGWASDSAHTVRPTAASAGLRLPTRAGARGFKPVHQ
jgi:hypothetical protein